MKKSIVFLTGIFFLSLCLSLQPLSGQEKTQEEKEKEAKLQQTLEIQKKAMSDQQKKTIEMERALKEKLDFGTQSSGSADAITNYRRAARSSGNSWDIAEPFIVSPGVEFSGLQYFGRGGDSERTTWDFSKHVKETTFSKSYSFDVEKTVGTVVMTVMGDCKAGEIRVKILMPGGKTYSDILIDEYGNLNWRKSFSISDEENKDKTGEWIFKIDAAKATGYFKISLQTY